LKGAKQLLFSKTQRNNNEQTIEALLLFILEKVGTHSQYHTGPIQGKPQNIA
jgi:hypothetical protein